MPPSVRKSATCSPRICRDRGRVVSSDPSAATYQWSRNTSHPPFDVSLSASSIRRRLNSRFSVLCMVTLSRRKGGEMSLLEDNRWAEKVFIEKWTDGGDGSFSILEPATGDDLGRVGRASV